jgi:hypothetical protein
VPTDHGRISFRGNPWPKGHRIAQIRWSGRLEEDGLYFDLHLKSADYYEEDDRDDDEEDDDWRSRAVWGNYHACTLSSTYWPGEAKGLLVGTAKRPLRFATLASRRLRAEPLPVDLEERTPAFCVYLLGHDSVADHRLRFEPVARGVFSLTWRARIALTYIGHTDFAHELVARVPRVAFGGVAGPKGMSTREAAEMLARFAEPKEYGPPVRRAGRAVFPLRAGARR